MKKSSEYDRNAQECRALATQMRTGEQREQLLNIAEMWRRLAQDRSDLVRKHPELEQAPANARRE